MPSVFFNGDADRKVAGNCHVGFAGVESEALLVTLDAAGVYAAAGSSCSSGATEPSHVLEAMGLSHADALASVRFSLGFASTNSDVATALDVVPRAVAQLRDRSRRDSERVLVAMSGGVDSSVAAALLLEAGHDVTGVTLKLWGGESDSGCCSVADVEDARRVAAQLDIPHYVFNFTDDFEANVVAPYADAYAAGRTPNPCVECNRTMKFGRLLDRSRGDGLRRGRDRSSRPDRVRRRGPSGAPRAVPTPRRTSPTSSTCSTQHALDRVRLPVGELTKAEVRAHARRLGLRTADKRESMDVCFITSGGKDAFLAARIAARARRARHRPTARWSATHAGVDAFTIGQRRGLGVALGERRFVVDVDAATRTVTLGERDGPAARRAAGARPDVRRRRPRDRTRPCSCRSRAHGEPFTGRWQGDRVVCDAPQPRVAPGQVIALYRGDVLLGGGIAA